MQLPSEESEDVEEEEGDEEGEEEQEEEEVDQSLEHEEALLRARAKIDWLARWQQRLRGTANKRVQVVQVRKLVLDAFFWQE